MARVCQTGFEIGVSSLASPDGAFTAATISTAIKRSGNSSLKCSGASQSCSIQLTTAVTTQGYLSFWIYKSANPAATGMVLQLPLGGIYLKTDGSFAIYTSGAVQIGSASAVASSSEWHKIDVYWVSTTSSSATFRLNGTEVASGQVSVNPANFASVSLMGISGIDVYFDDLTANDTTGTVNNSWCGDSRVLLLLPISDNTVTNFTGGSGGTTSLYDAVNNVPPSGLDNTAANPNGVWSNTTQIKCANNSGTSLYKANLQTYSDAGIVSSDTINAVIAWACHAEEINTGTKSGAVSLTANPSISSASFSYGDDVSAIGDYPTNWRWKATTVSEAPSVTLGSSPVVQITKTDTTTRVAHCCFLGAYVDYTPGFNQDTWRLRNDDGSESAATWKAAAGADATQTVSGNTKARIRFALSASSASDVKPILEAGVYSGGTVATWFDVTTTSSKVRAADSANVTDAGDTTQQITSGTFISPNSGISETGTAGTDLDMDFTASSKTEVEYVIEFVDADLADGEQIAFRIKNATTRTAV